VQFIFQTNKPNLTFNISGTTRTISVQTDTEEKSWRSETAYSQFHSDHTCSHNGPFLL